MDELKTAKPVKGYEGLYSVDDSGTGIKNINAVPAADVRPVVRGRWINAYPKIEPNPMYMYGICSECGFEQSISNKLNYCPNCGADMREVTSGDTGTKS